MRVLVTGAGGFIGRCVSDRLAGEGNEVIRIVRHGGEPGAAALEPALSLDLCEPGVIQRSLKGRPDTVVHLAAAIPSSFIGAEAEQAAQVNRRIDENVFLACREMGVGAVYASGTSVYGVGNGEEKNEDSPTSPIGPYVTEKLVGEKMGEQLLERQGLPFTVLRINAPYGPGQRARTVLRLFLERALAGLPLQFHGTGSRQQDFTYVDDVADAVSRACRVGRSGLYNISGGNPVTMRELADLVVLCVPACGSHVGPSGVEDAQEGAAASYSIARAKRVLGWEPRVSLEVGIKASIENWTQ